MLLAVFARSLVLVAVLVPGVVATVGDSVASRAAVTATGEPVRHRRSTTTMRRPSRALSITKSMPLCYVAPFRRPAERSWVPDFYDVGRD
jgi:hypothetical protein